MDFLNKKFIAALGQLREQVEALRKSIDSTRDHNERQHQQTQAQRELPAPPIRVEAKIDEEPCKKTQEDSYRKSSLRAQWVTAIATSAAFIAAAIYAGNAARELKQMRIATEAASKSANVAAKQLELIERPKVLGLIKFTHPARISSKEGMDVDLLLTLNNNGQTAAIKTNIQSDMSPIMRMGGAEIDEVRERLCKSAIQLSKSSTENFFPTVYPGIPAHFNIGLKIQPTLINEMIWDGRAIMPFITICIAYHPDFTDADYHTAFVYQVARLDESRPGQRLVFCLSTEPFPLRDLTRENQK